jgi:hypothetical protein
MPAGSEINPERLIKRESDSEGSAAAAAAPPKKNVRTYYCSKNHSADSYRHLSVPFLVDRIIKLATTGFAVNLSCGENFSLRCSNGGDAP